MRKLKWLLPYLLSMMMVAVPCLASVVNSVAVPPTRSTGDLITAAIWNNDVLGVYTYINNTLLPVLNVVTTKGDLYVYNGSALARQGVGPDNQVLTADSAQANGIKWAAFVNTTQLTTKGDLLTYGVAAARLPVGTDGQVLIADSTQSSGIKWGAAPAAPSGTIVAWSPTFAGTNNIPSGWLLCDGTNSTPNLIGKFIVGTRPSGSTATPAAGGFGAQTVDANGAGTAAHTHTMNVAGNTAGPTGLQAVASGSTANVSSSTHVHAISFSGTSGSTTLEPSDYALVYIMKS